MNNFFRKTLGGLSKEYYIRQLFFGILLLTPMFLPYWMGPPELKNEGSPPWNVILISLINLPLYPYSRFIYETAVNYILGDNMFILPAPILLFAKLMTMVMCFYLAIFIAPIGLAFLYYHHTKAEKELNRQHID